MNRQDADFHAAMMRGLPPINPPNGLEVTEYREIELPPINPPNGLEVTEYREIELTDIRQSESTHYPLTAEQIAEGNTTEERR